jgi:16S rRNA (guanine527-N7)-methyltransferase
MSPEGQEPLPPERFEEALQRQEPSFPLGAIDVASRARLARYLSELDRWRRKINLTGALSAQELAAHALESILGSKLIAHGEGVVDIGSGAGFPGLPLAIARPDLSVTLVEPRQKKAAFLRHCVRELPLGNATVFQGRIEEVGGQTFQSATTRAVGHLPTWIGGGAFLAPAGALLAWTTEPERLETDLAPLFSLESSIEIPGTARRRIAVYRKRS